MHRETWPNLVVFSHLRWNFVYQRPQHLLARAARDRNVFYFEEPTFEDTSHPHIEEQVTREGVRLLVPRVPRDTEPARLDGILRELLDTYVMERVPGEFALWYYTPMALNFSRHLPARAVIYDCMDELSAFRFAPPALMELERELLGRADLVFTGGRSLFEAKRNLHPDVHAFPSSIDYAHFARARGSLSEPADQSAIPHPRVGYFGVIDERLDYELLAGLANARPGWQFVMIGPLAKVSPESLPRRANIHYLGMKPYAELPSYLRGWDVAMMPFARNASTRFISPTKTPEFLAAGRPVVSTSIPDVVKPYGEAKVVRIADDVASFVAQIECAISDPHDQAWRRRVDELLAGNSWNLTWLRMRELESGLYPAREHFPFSEVERWQASSPF